MTITVEVDTPEGPGRWHLDPAVEPSAVLALGHGAGGGVTAMDLTLLAQQLPDRGITVARAGYWRAYELSFRTSERVKVASTDIQRIREYQDLADRAGSAVVYIETEPCEWRQELEEFAGWHLCR